MHNGQVAGAHWSSGRCTLVKWVGTSGQVANGQWSSCRWASQVDSGQVHVRSGQVVVVNWQINSGQVQVGSGQVGSSEVADEQCSSTGG